VSAFPERLWQPSVKDAVSQLAPVRVCRVASSAVAAAAIDLAIFTVPRDFVMLLRAVFLQLSAGAAQTVTAGATRFEDPGAVVIGRLEGRQFSDGGLAAAPVNMNVNWTGEALVMPGEVIICNGVFSAGGAANTVIASVHGILVPRGNWQIS